MLKNRLALTSLPTQEQSRQLPEKSPLGFPGQLLGPHGGVGSKGPHGLHIVLPQLAAVVGEAEVKIEPWRSRVSGPIHRPPPSPWREAKRGGCRYPHDHT